jgi:hypothetical protein
MSYPHHQLRGRAANHPIVAGLCGDAALKESWGIVWGLAGQLLLCSTYESLLILVDKPLRCTYTRLALRTTY